MDRYLVRLKPGATWAGIVLGATPGDDQIIGKWHIEGVPPRTRWGMSGLPTRCGRELQGVVGIGTVPGHLRWALLWASLDRPVASDTLCKQCFREEEPDDY